MNELCDAIKSKETTMPTIKLKLRIEGLERSGRSWPSVLGEKIMGDGGGDVEERVADTEEDGGRHLFDSS